MSYLDAKEEADLVVYLVESSTLVYVKMRHEARKRYCREVRY